MDEVAGAPDRAAPIHQNRQNNLAAVGRQGLEQDLSNFSLDLCPPPP